jgi:hypothetical protein
VIVRVEGHTYDVPEPAGVEGLALFEAVAGLAVSLGLLSRVASPMPWERAARYREAALALVGLPSARAAIEATLTGARVDGVAYAPQMWEALWSHRPRYLEPYLAALEAWGELGFFGAPPPPVGAADGAAADG